MSKHLAKIDPPLYLRNKRASKWVSRKIRKTKYLKRNAISKKEQDERFGNVSKILLLISGLKQANPLESKGRVRYKAPKIFSLMENPQGVLDSIQSFAEQLLEHQKLRRVFVDLSDVEVYDLGANSLLDVLVEEASYKADRTGRRIHWSGAYPQDPSLRRFVKSMGVIKKLKISHEYPHPEEANKVNTYDARCRNYVRATRLSEVDKKNRVTSQFADHINSCLKRVERRLTQSAQSYLCKYISEILDNAEEHADMFDWSIQGYLDTHKNDWEIEIVILNFGRTIAESLDSLSPSHYCRKKIQPYLDTHEKSGFFQLRGWKRESLLTLIALQGGVSSKNESDALIRGIGTVELISFFQTMCDQLEKEGAAVLPVKMTLISGDTEIIFDNSYKMTQNSDGISVIAFNRENDLYIPPDPNYVKEIKGASFPGTVLSIKFQLPRASTSDVERAQT